MAQTIRYVVVHHTGGTAANARASTAGQLASNVDAYHKAKWNFRSSLGRYGGYNFFVDRYGGVAQFRAIGEETAAQIGHNTDAISICLAGNFTAGVDAPTAAQEAAVVDLLERLMGPSQIGDLSVIPGTHFDLDATRIVPHRALGQTGCNGSGLPDSWGRDLHLKSQGTSGAYRLAVALLARVRALLGDRPLPAGALDDRGCGGFTG